MASLSNPEEVILHYKYILNKTKKKLFRKLNTLEPSDLFEKLAISCQKNDKNAYAAFCWQAVAKCEESMGHSCEEAIAHQKAARQYFHEFKKTESSGFISPYNEYLHAALSEMCRVEDSFQGNSFENILKTSARLETADTLVKLGDYEGALLTFTDIANVASNIHSDTLGVHCDILSRCEISRVFLLLILKPTRQKMPSELTLVLEKYMWINGDFDSPVEFISDELFRLLRSLIKAYQLGETSCLYTIESDLTPHLTLEQRKLLSVLINTLT
ncbi:40-kDa huntingtin-associated protein-like isoform X2 [Daktulosphaira vitifoliae]|uniref:40-kDa huntingtin-associated protein-like isoform X2 n=1 Tax=Daktulosphaira vitifoliae TaxID=58002 RepID=UPI0021AAD217|nr:40-kDa huntingtin-associated protein-like isoform X2 [Daktulosphaira vitifoliae]